MTSQQPTRFENYPPDPLESGGFGEPSPDAPPNASGRGVMRRTLIGVGVGLPVLWLGSVTLGRMLHAQDPPSRPDDASSEVTPSAEPDRVSIGRHSATVPEGWNVAGDVTGALVLTCGNNRVLARVFAARTTDRAEDLIGALTERSRGDFVGSLDGAVNDGAYLYVRHAAVSAHGTLDGMKARLGADLWIDEGNLALLTVKTLTAVSGSEIAAAADRLVRELSLDL